LITVLILTQNKLKHFQDMYSDLYRTYDIGVNVFYSENKA